MKLLIFVGILLQLFNLSQSSEIKIISINIRHLRQNDFGLIFDGVVSNDGSSPKEALSFVLHSDNCCLMINNVLDCDMQKLLGARINNLEPNKKILITMVWPTLVLYNRIGNCSVHVTVFRSSFGPKHGETIDDTTTISFNTMINTKALPDFLLHYFNDMKKARGYKQCDSEDQDPFNNCKPVNCELKYFGKRNFFQAPNCIPATLCDQGANSIYDFEKNVCRDSKQVFSSNDLTAMAEGKFTNWIDQVGLEQDRRDLIEKKTMLKRLRRSLNEPRDIAENLSSALFFIFKLIVLICFVYLLMCLAIFVVCSVCIGCGFVTASSPIVYTNFDH